MPDGFAGGGPRLRQRTLLVWGRQDGLAPPALATEFTALMPDAVTAFLDGCGHYPMDEQPGRLFALLEDFLAGGRPMTPGRAYHPTARGPGDEG
jgi:pimeloyl-ACP methyl ester carboxylesterase